MILKSMQVVKWQGVSGSFLGWVFAIGLAATDGVFAVVLMVLKLLNEMGFVRSHPREAACSWELSDFPI